MSHMKNHGDGTSPQQHGCGGCETGVFLCRGALCDRMAHADHSKCAKCHADKTTEEEGHLAISCKTVTEPPLPRQAPIRRQALGSARARGEETMFA